MSIKRYGSIYDDESGEYAWVVLADGNWVKYSEYIRDLAAMREALGFYADRMNWYHDKSAPGYELTSLIEIDGGDKARKVLHGEGGNDK